MNHFHCEALDQGTVSLPEDEAHHALHVLRLRPGAVVGLLDGRGMRAKAQLVSVDKRGVTAHIVERSSEPEERLARIHLAVAPTKNAERFEWFLEKAVEIGVDRITPLITERTERIRLRTDRLHRIAVSAMKQSMRAWLPQIDQPTELATLLVRAPGPQRFFGWCEGAHASLMESYDAFGNALVLIGPEGDFTTEEAGAMQQAGCHAVTLGRARLRTETAALAACTWMSLAQQQ